MSHTLVNCTCKNRLGCSLLPFTLLPQYLKRFNWLKTRLNKRNWKTKQRNSPSFGFFSLASTISRSFQSVRLMREGWKRERYVRSQCFSSESAVKFLHVGRRKIQISPPLPLGEQDQSNALPIPQGQQRQSNARPPHALPPPPPHPPPAWHW